MAKILISSLGTGPKKDGTYIKATYKIDEKQYTTSFIADALTQHHKIDKIFLVGTKKSMWDEAYVSFGGEDEEYHEYLYTQKENGKINSESLQQLEQNFPKGSKCFLIDYGINQDQLWDNFEVFVEMTKYIEDGDQLYLDITHSFRSLSLMSFVMTQFASTISDKNFTISGVYYGMLEYSHENNSITPIVDIKVLLEIQEWIKAIDAIKRYSDFEPLVQMMQTSDVENSVQNTFISLSNNISMANLGAMKQFIDTAHKKINAIKTSENKIIKLLAPEIIKLIDQLKHEKMSDFQYELAKWFYANKNYAMSYIALYEAIISKSCEESGMDLHDYEQRQEAKKSIGHYKYGNYFYTKHPDSISQIRNALVHQSNERKDKVKNDINRLNKFILHFESYFKGEG